MERQCGCAFCASISDAHKMANTGACDNGDVCKVVVIGVDNDDVCKGCPKYGKVPKCSTPELWFKRQQKRRAGG